jgi:hypothetical protein
MYMYLGFSGYFFFKLVTWTLDLHPRRQLIGDDLWQRDLVGGMLVRAPVVKREAVGGAKHAW